MCIKDYYAAVRSKELDIHSHMSKHKKRKLLNEIWDWANKMRFIAQYHSCKPKMHIFKYSFCNFLWESVRWSHRRSQRTGSWKQFIILTGPRGKRHNMPHRTMWKNASVVKRQKTGARESQGPLLGFPRERQSGTGETAQDWPGLNNFSGL